MEINYAVEIEEQIFAFLMVTPGIPASSDGQASIYFSRIQLLNKWGLLSVLFCFGGVLVIIKNNSAAAILRKCDLVYIKILIDLF